MKANTLRFSIILLTALTLAACTTPTDEPPSPGASETYTPIPTKTPTSTKTPTPTATQTETPTEVPISYDIPMTADGKIDIDNIINVVPESKEDREAYFAKVKAYLVAQQAIQYPDVTVSETGYRQGMPLCRVGIDGKDWDPATQVRVSCGADYGGTISPGLLSKDIGGNVIMTFLVNLQGTDGKWVPKLINVAIYPDEMDRRMKAVFGFDRSADDIWGQPWGTNSQIIITFGGNIRAGYTKGLYPNLEALIDKNYKEGIRDEMFDLFNADNWKNFDGVVSPAFSVVADGY